MAKDIYDLIIIGGGPAGITAGIYGAREKLKILLIAKSFGGQMARKAVAIENYPGFKEVSGLELINKFEEHVKKFDVEIEKSEVSKIEKKGKDFIVSTKEKKDFFSRAVVLASGADPRPIEVPGEKEFLGRGVSYCTVCDGPLFKNKRVAVVGGGNSGIEAALSLSKHAKEVFVLERGPEIKASKIVQEKISASKKINIITSAALKEIKGKNFVESLVYEDCCSGDIKTLELQGVFIEIGSQPATCFVKDLVDFNGRDEIKINPNTCETRTSGLFAAGDVTNVMLKQIVVAAGEGAKAAISAYRYLSSQ